MKVIVFAQRYAPDAGTDARRVSSAARKFAGSGFTVEVVTGFPDFPGGDARGGRLLSFERDGLVHVTRLWRYAGSGELFVAR